MAVSSYRHCKHKHPVLAAPTAAALCPQTNAVTGWRSFARPSSLSLSLPLYPPLSLSTHALSHRFTRWTTATRCCCDSKEEGADTLGWALDMHYTIKMGTQLYTYPSTIISLIIDKNILVLEHVLPTERWEWEERLDKQSVKTLVINMLRNDGHRIIVMTSHYWC